MRKPQVTRQFEKDIKRMESRGLEMLKLSVIISALAKAQPLEARHKDHPLKGDYVNTRECHIEPDWLLIYRADDETLLLLRTGTHSDLFK